MRVSELAKFMIARDTARQNKEAGQPKPWTKDKIIQTYRFCNVHREDDAVSRWLRRTYYPSFKGHQDIGFAAVVARLLNNPDSLYAVAINRKFVLPWKPEMFRQVLHTRKADGKKNFNAAYIVSTNGVAMDKVDYLAARVLGPLWAGRKDLRPRNSLDQWHKVLMEYDGLGSFIAAQVIADLKYLPPLFDTALGIPTSFADDWYTFAASGPGSRRGLNRVMGRPADYHQSEISWRLELGELARALPSKLPFVVGNGLHAQDVQNCLCEFDKYERIRLGEGRPKQLYPGRSGQ